MDIKSRANQTHRTHQSLGHLGALSVVSDKISSMARRRTLHPDDVSDSTMEDSPLRSHLRDDRLHPEVIPRSRTDRFLRRAHDTRGSMTDEESGVSRLKGFGRRERLAPKPPVTPAPEMVSSIPRETIRAVRESEENERLLRERDLAEAKRQAVIYSERSR